MAVGAWKQVVQLLERRPGWHLQARPSPGAPPAWCYGSASEVELTVTVERDAIRLYLVQTDEDVELESVSDLVAWLTAHKTGSLADRVPGLLDKLKRGQLFTWD
ncbi:MAG: hypothetical protein ACYCTE_10905 [Acidimicrobiales bacterium]